MSTKNPAIFRKIPCSATLATWALTAVILSAQPISPRLVGNNLWLASRTNAAGTPSAAVMNLSGQAGIRLIRIGGHQFDSNMPSNQALLTWVNRIRATGAEPLIQVSQYQTAADAASAVQFINVTSAANVKYWSIGNEPWLQANNREDPNPTESQIAASIETYFKARAVAMKAVDPSIRIFGVDSEDFQSGLHARLFGGANNIAGKIPGQDYYYCDGLSWHRYPQGNDIDPTYEGLADIRTRIQNCRTLVDSVNVSQGRTGAEALTWAIGEINSKNGAVVHTWGNGQMFAGFFGLSMKHAAEFVAPWSLYESEGARSGTDFSLFDGEAMVPRPSYWHSQFVAKHFTGNYLEGNPSVSSNTSELLVYGAEDESKDQISVMILNRGFNTRPYTLHLNNGGTAASPGATAINVDAARPETYNDTLPPRSTHVIVFAGGGITKTSFTNDDFIAGNPPQVAVVPGSPASPLAGILDDFSNDGNLAEQGYWQTLDIGAGQSSVANGNLVLHAADTAHASATIGSPIASSFNFFNRGFAISLTGFQQAASELPDNETQFRLCLNSNTNRSFGSDDSLVLRISPGNIRLGYKINQPGVQGELRAGTAITDDSLLNIDHPGSPDVIRLSLQPMDNAGGVTTVLYHVQIDGSAGKTHRSGTFDAAASDWGSNGNSSLVLESRRNADAAGGPGSYAEAVIGAVYHQPLLLDDFNDPQSATINYWNPLLVGATSTATVNAGSVVLTARASSFASAAIAGNLIPETNFFENGFTLDFDDMVLNPSGIDVDASIFRISLCSTVQRSFTTPDALTLRLTPGSIAFGLKLDQPSVDAENRTGAAATPLSFIDQPLVSPVTGVRLTLIPTGAATEIFYGILLTGPGDSVHFTGTFNADPALWGAAGESSLVMESRRATAVTGSASSYMETSVGTVRFTPLPDDFLEHCPSYLAWRFRQFSADEIAAAAITGPHAEPAGDGINNLLKYAFGLEAKLPAIPGRLPDYAEGMFHHSERSNARDLNYIIEASTDMAAWNVPVIEQSRGAAASGWVPVGSRADLPVDSPRVFYRARILNSAEP